MHQSIAELCNNSNTYFHEYILRIPSTLRCFCTGFDLFSEYCFEDHSYSFLSCRRKTTHELRLLMVYVFRNQIYAPRATCVVHKGLFCFQTPLFYHKKTGFFKRRFPLPVDLAGRQGASYFRCCAASWAAS